MFLFPHVCMRLHFRKAAAKQAGLNPYMVEIANIREHCSWIHKDMEEATKKAVILARAAIAKVNAECASSRRETARLQNEPW